MEDQFGFLFQHSSLTKHIHLGIQRWEHPKMSFKHSRIFFSKGRTHHPSVKNLSFSLVVSHVPPSTVECWFQSSYGETHCLYDNLRMLSNINRWISSSSRLIYYSVWRMFCLSLPKSPHFSNPPICFQILWCLVNALLLLLMHLASDLQKQKNPELFAIS